MRPSDFGRTLRTLRHLGPKQAWYYLRRRVAGDSRVRTCKNAATVTRLSSVRWCPFYAPAKDEWSFKFLNCELAFEDNQIDWCPAQTSRLWRYHLHYFDYLQDPARSRSTARNMVNQWIEANPQGSKPGWEPYPTSLRIVNWVKYFMAYPDAVDQSQLNSLFTQTRWLRENMEYHIRANHYFENIKALIFAGSYFAGEEAKHWLEFASRELEAQLVEQALPDGGHYERSPAYHCLMLRNYLEIYALTRAGQNPFSSELHDTLRSKAVSGMEFLHDILLPTQQFPLFNDSAFNAAPSPQKLADYASSLGLPDTRAGEYRWVSRADSGIYGYVTPTDGLLLKCGDIGPSYQPGHTHCDLLSYELVMDGQPVVVDSGVFEYAPGSLRTLARSTAAHNTCAVKGAEQSEIWGEFRVGHRARVLAAEATLERDQWLFEGSFEGFYAVPGRVTHGRKVAAAPWGDSLTPRTITVTDQLTGKGHHTIESYIHLHPDIVAVGEHPAAIRLSVAGEPLAVIHIPDNINYQMKPSLYCPEFGIKCDSRMIVLTINAELPVELTYRIERLAQ